MDVAVALVEAYLQVNGYLTVTEYPVLEALRHGEVRTATDLDVLAFRFARAGAASSHRRRRTTGPVAREPDAALGVRPGHADMIIGEVKQGAARLNPAMRDPAVLGAALVRFGCCDAGAADGIVQRLLATGESATGHGHTVRMIAFGSSPDRGHGAYRIVSIDHIVQFLREYLRQHRSVLSHAQLTHPTLALFALLDKRRAHRRRNPTAHAETEPDELADDVAGRRDAGPG